MINLSIDLQSKVETQDVTLEKVCSASASWDTSSFMPQWEMPPPAVPAREDLPSIPAVRLEEVQSASLDPTPSIPPPPTLLLNLARTNDGEYLWYYRH